MSDKKITINILPQHPGAWVAIAIACAFIGMGFGSGDSKVNIERERTRRILELANKGMTNAVIEEIRKNLTPTE